MLFCFSTKFRIYILTNNIIKTSVKLAELYYSYIIALFTFFALLNLHTIFLYLKLNVIKTCFKIIAVLENYVLIKERCFLLAIFFFKCLKIYLNISI